MGVTKIKLN